MNQRITLAALILTLPLLLCAEASLACGKANVILHLSSSKIHITNGLKCIEVADPSAPINATMTINLPSAANYPLENGQVNVTTTVPSSSDEEFPVKSSDDDDLACDPGIEFDGTNTGNSDMDVAITGEVTTTGVGCYDVVIGGLGRLDPRAKIVDQNAAIGIGAELAEVFGSIEVLKNTNYGPMFDILTLEEFFQSAYGISEEEARRLANNYSDEEANTGY